MRRLTQVGVSVCAHRRSASPLTSLLRPTSFSADFLAVPSRDSRCIRLERPSSGGFFVRFPLHPYTRTEWCELWEQRMSGSEFGHKKRRWR
mmetsp:Transcript_7550/g.18701  ORF Transcript_7550/g.18701 Transcript_7550/m.18701 type:complete len:91 (+) Transcript_7550:20-292(+)